MSRYRRGRGNDDAVSLIAWLLVIIVAMPFTGLYFLLRKDPSKRWLGWVLLIIGIILWIAVLAGA